ncbi:outer membrane lipoprotein chaperone LolA [Marinimicrobium alkaliphilum]|uniref:outer membrane lipoprotein chaperone LolA n=1 Tax=Marinimicrobium alkaliphilum TaxID=2202654 RepID=UPI000DBA356E|nr:outer membrane lipoprotein chaperone LolA [Marinimicrobium alkaliphilum]
MGNTFKFAVATLGLLLTLPALAQSAAEQLRDRLAATDSMRGDFEQTLMDSDGTLLDDSSGEFAVQRPGQFYWHTREPYEQLLVSNHEVVWLYDPDLEQATLRQFTEDVQRTPALLLSGDLEKLQDNFVIERLPDENDRSAYLLSPTEREGLFQELTLVFNADVLTEIRLEDSLGQISVFALSPAQRNQPIDAALFEFEPPEGVDIMTE